MTPRLRMAGRRLVASDTRRITPIDTARKEKKVDSFYISAEWKAFRNALRFERGWYCQDPKCETPSGPWKMIYGHHIVELTDGGAALDRRNVMLVCGTCHGRLTAENKSKREAGREQPREANAIRFGHSDGYNTRLWPAARRQEYLRRKQHATGRSSCRLGRAVGGALMRPFTSSTRRKLCFRLRGARRGLSAHCARIAESWSSRMDHHAWGEAYRSVSASPPR